ncbi:DNA polymerase zeta catalytic subunit [Trichonephila clavipes]|nr:DNA polymerase zeta catalytic subunit [Trichonephila clavipes]
MTLYPIDMWLHIYTDGSAQNDSSAGAGFCENLFEGSLTADLGATNFNASAILTLCSLRSRLNRGGGGEREKIHELNGDDWTIIFQWIPGSEKADFLAKHGCNLPWTSGSLSCRQSFSNISRSIGKYIYLIQENEAGEDLEDCSIVQSQWVYLPCVLQTKKRYCGFMYETPDQESPIFDAKGIETVRRDSCPATAKILEKSLKILFRTRDVDAVKYYVQKQFAKILKGHVSILDFIFAKEYRGMAGYRPGACVPALEIAKKRLAKDPRAEPRSGERVPYVIVYGFPGMPIIRLVHEPADLLRDPSLRINATYYITRVISPPLERIFSLMGANVKSWWGSQDFILAHCDYFQDLNKTSPVALYLSKTFITPVPFWIADTGQGKGETNVRCDPTSGWEESHL